MTSTPTVTGGAQTQDGKTNVTSTPTVTGGAQTQDGGQAKAEVQQQSASKAQPQNSGVKVLETKNDVTPDNTWSPKQTTPLDSSVPTKSSYSLPRTGQKMLNEHGVEVVSLAALGASLAAGLTYTARKKKEVS
ncbi:unnamed protein product [Fructobacillus tropaeoli]|nr:unnamed protein product [Fructobacillus tropaeoli]